jgi:hypothetical protein
VKAIVQDHQIYSVEEGKDTIITLSQNHAKLVISDGYHITKPLELVYHHIHTYYFHVDCILSNTQLFYGGFLMAVSGLLGLFTGSLFFQLLSFVPLLYLLYIYYINRSDFIQLHPM